jgi:hypothetical protein
LDSTDVSALFSLAFLHPPRRRHSVTKAAARPIMHLHLYAVGAFVGDTCPPSNYVLKDLCLTGTCASSHSLSCSISHKTEFLQSFHMVVLLAFGKACRVFRTRARHASLRRFLFVSSAVPSSSSCPRSIAATPCTDSRTRCTSFFAWLSRLLKYSPLSLPC